MIISLQIFGEIESFSPDCGYGWRGWCLLEEFKEPTGEPIGQTEKNIRSHESHEWDGFPHEDG